MMIVTRIPSSAVKSLRNHGWRLAVLLAVLGGYCVTFAHGADRAALSPDEASEGFVPIFDGQTLNGWQGATEGYAVRNGLLVAKESCAGALLTEREFGDFIFRFEFRLEPGGNNGISIRGMESQILDDDAPQYKNLKPFQYHGSIIRCRVAPKRGHTKPAGEWNRQEIECRGSRWKITLNGVVIIDVDLAQLPGEEASALAKQTKGRLGLLGHHSHVEFRNLRVKEL